MPEPRGVHSRLPLIHFNQGIPGPLAGDARGLRPGAPLYAAFAQRDEFINPRASVAQAPQCP